MNLNTLKNADGARKPRTRVGRGPSSGLGKTSGRGHKGQKARSGYSARAGFEGGQMPLHRRIPKRGFHHEKRFAMAEVNVDVLESRFDAGEEVTTASLVARAIVVPERGGVKLLGRGELTKKLIVKVQAVSPGARAKIESAGGSVECVKLAAE